MRRLQVGCHVGKLDLRVLSFTRCWRVRSHDTGTEAMADWMSLVCVDPSGAVVTNDASDRQ